VSRSASPVVRRKVLAARLRRLRLAAGLTLEDAARALEFSTATMSRIENEQRLPRVRDVRDLARLYGAGDDVAADLAELVEASKEAGWWEKYSEIDDDYGSLIGHESAAVSIGEYRGSTIPGLLQAPAYIRAYLTDAINPQRVNPFTPKDISRRVEVAMQRQQILSSSSLQSYSAFLDEATVRRCVGGAAVMAEQLHHLVDLLDRIERVSIRLIPFDRGAHPGQPGGFCLLRLPEEEVSDVVYVDSLAGQLFLETTEDLTRHERVLARLQDIALTRDETREALLETARPTGG